MSDDPILPPAWQAIRNHRSAWFGLYWFGLSDRTRADRLERLCAETAGARTLAAMKGLSAAELAQLDTLAKLNAEQAEAAFRRGLVFNLTLPAGLLAGLAQLAPNLFAEVGDTIDWASPRVIVLAVAMAFLIAGLMFAFIRARDARDLADLVTIAKAKADRGA